MDKSLREEDRKVVLEQEKIEKGVIKKFKNDEARAKNNVRKNSKMEAYMIEGQKDLERRKEANR